MAKDNEAQRPTSEAEMLLAIASTLIGKAKAIDQGEYDQEITQAFNWGKMESYLIEIGELLGAVKTILRSEAQG